MKKIILSTIGLLLVIATVITMSSCNKQVKENDTPEEVQAEEVADAEVASEEAADPNTLEGYDSGDAMAFGLLGPVKQVVTTRYEATLKGNHLKRGERINDGSNSKATFNRQGLVTRDIFGSPYTYDSNGKFIKGRKSTTEMERSPRGLIEKYVYCDDTEEGHWDSYSFEFHYDQEGRMTSYNWTGWEELAEYTLIYEGDNVYPSKEEMDGCACADLFKEHITYKYTKFDDRGNWTEREKYIISETGTDPGVDGGDPEMDVTKAYVIETRKIEYYEK